MQDFLNSPVSLVYTTTGMMGLKVLTSKFGKIPRIVFQSGKYFFITALNVTRAKKTMAFYGWLGQIA